MMVAFQDKIIYMPNVPPFARSEKLEDYTAQCKPVEWQSKHISSHDGTKLAVCCGTIPGDVNEPARTKHVIICYFQGNGGSLPPRLPILSAVLKLLAAESSANHVRYSIVALSYRGYWGSSGRATQSGIELDARSVLKFVAETYSFPDTNVDLILWGQSIGAGVATTLAAAHVSSPGQCDLPISRLILETPFTSVRSMLTALYPQKWLPYRYLWPFLWNHWDSAVALRTLGNGNSPPKIFLLPGSRDEVVPPMEVDRLEGLCKEMGLPYERQDIAGALHNEVSIKREGQRAIVRFVMQQPPPVK
jgi:hypothetical protein